MNAQRFKDIPGALLHPVPIAVYQPALRRIARFIAEKHPDLFARLGDDVHKAFLINPTNMPFVLLLEPDPDFVSLEAYRSAEGLDYDASITGSFLNLLRMIDVDLDGDALFFSRDLKIEGDTEAIVRLRNAMDDIEGSVAGDVASMFGPLGRGVLASLRRLGEDRHAV
ncbi:MAG: SCP2 domain-containing protein [Alphaproteobacteria bacterium]